MAKREIQVLDEASLPPGSDTTNACLKCSLLENVLSFIRDIESEVGSIRRVIDG